MTTLTPRLSLPSLNFIRNAFYRTSRRTPSSAPVIIVLHSTEGGGLFRGAARAVMTWASRNDKTANPYLVSTHFAVDAQEIITGVSTSDTAFTCGAFNDLSVNIEHCWRANYTAEDSAARGGGQLAVLSASLVAELCIEHDIPCRRLSVDELVALYRAWQTSQRRSFFGNTTKRGLVAESTLALMGGVCTHYDITQACRILKLSGNHTDPGPTFPTDWIIETAATVVDEVLNPVAPPVVMPPSASPTPPSSPITKGTKPMYFICVEDQDRIGGSVYITDGITAKHVPGDAFDSLREFTVTPAVNYLAPDLQTIHSDIRRVSPGALRVLLTAAARL